MEHYMSEMQHFAATQSASDVLSLKIILYL